MNDERAGERVTVVRGHNVQDSAGNRYGILDLHPDPADLAVLLGVWSAARGERAQFVLRPGTPVARLGLRVQAVSIETSARPERVTLVVEPE